MAVKSNFASGDVLTASDVNTYLTNGGLVYVAAATLSTVTNTISNVFSSTYENYFVTLTNFLSNGTTTRSIGLRFGTDATANYANTEIGAYPTNVSFNSSTGGNTIGTFCASSNQVEGQYAGFYIYGPNLAKPTVAIGNVLTYQNNVGTVVSRTFFIHHAVSTSYTGFQIIGTTDNLAGTVRVYGVRQA